MKHTVWGQTPVDGYIVSIDGAVISLAREIAKNSKHSTYLMKKQQLLLNPSNSKGYLKVTLGTRQITVHNLMGKVFLRKKSWHDQVCHRNDVGHDNKIENLYWGDTSDNIRDAHRNRAYNMARIEAAKLVNSRSIRIKYRGDVREYDCQASLCRDLKCSGGSVTYAKKSGCLLMKKWTIL